MNLALESNNMIKLKKIFFVFALLFFQDFNAQSVVIINNHLLLTDLIVIKIPVPYKENSNLYYTLHRGGGVILLIDENYKLIICHPNHLSDYVDPYWYYRSFEFASCKNKIISIFSLKDSNDTKTFTGISNLEEDQVKEISEKNNKT